MKFEDWIRNKLPKDIQFEKYWRNKHCDWAEYMIDSNNLMRRSNLEINNWNRKNLIGRYCVYHSEIYFEFEEDSVLFALRWA